MKKTMMGLVSVVIIGIGLASQTACTVDPCPGGGTQCSDGTCTPGPGYTCCGNGTSCPPSAPVCGAGVCLGGGGGGGGGGCPNGTLVCGTGCIPVPSDCCAGGYYCPYELCGSDHTCRPLDSVDCGNGRYCQAGQVCVSGGSACQ
jgi:hypothetical protein